MDTKPIDRKISDTKVILTKTIPATEERVVEVTVDVEETKEKLDSLTSYREKQMVTFIAPIDRQIKILQETFDKAIALGAKVGIISDINVVK
jgi:hypothetical protein